MSPLYIAAILITSALIPPTLGQGYGPLPHKGKKHRTTTTTTLPPDIASLDIDGQQYQPGFINPVSSTPVSDNNLGSFNQPGSPPEGGGSYWWQNPQSPFSGVNPPPSAQPGGCGGGGAAAACGTESAPINIQGNPFLSGLKPGGTPPAQRVSCSGAGYICSPKHLCRNGVVIEDGQGLIQVRSEVQYCDAASEVCCQLPAAPNKPSGCAGYGPGGSCGEIAPAPVTPSQTGLVHVTPAPSQPSLIHVTPAPSQPGLVHVTPAPSKPGLVHIPPSPKPSFPVTGGQYPSASIPSPTYAPANNFGKPVPGTNGVPIGGSIYDATGRPVTPAPNPSPYTGPLNTTPHPGCAAALKCVPETYCTADGVMSNQPVFLTREQYENRVPLSECADPDTGAIGKCCRDPNYEDPWPGGMMMKNNGNGQQPDECGAGAACLHLYECGSQYRIQPARSCRVPLDGASGICCSSDQSAFPGGQPGGSFFPGTTPLSQKPIKKPITGYPQPKPDTQPFPKPYPSQPFPQPPPSQLFPQTPQSPQTFPQHIPSSPQPLPQPAPSTPQPLPHVPSSQSYPKPFPPSPQPSPSSPQPYPRPSPSHQPLPQPAPPSPQPFPHVPSTQLHPEPSPSSPQPYPQPSPSPQPFPQPAPSYQPLPQPAPSSPQPFPHVPSSQLHPEPSPSSPQPYPRPSPSHKPLPQPAPPSPQPFPHVPSSQLHPEPFPSSPQPYPRPSPSAPQPFPQPAPSPQPFPQVPSPSPQPFPHPVPPSPQPFPSPSSPQPVSQHTPSSPRPFTQPPAQPSHPVGTAQLPTYTKPVKSVPPKQPPSFPHIQPTQPQPQFPQHVSPQPIPQPGPQSHFPVPQPQPELPFRPSTGYSQAGKDCGIRRQVSRQGLSDTDAGFGEFPWQALVLLNSNQSALCSAAVISENAVITAAHCLHDLESSDIAVEVGTWRLLAHDQPKPIQVVQVAAIARHPNFDTSSLFNDLAVLILSKRLRFDDHIDKICLPPRGQDVTQFQRICIATGWGKKALQGNIPGSILHQIPVRLIPHSACEDTLRQTHLGRYFILNPSFQCAIPTSPSQDLCKVDVGGPIGCDRGDGHYVLSGLYSWDVGCNVPSSPSVLGGIDVAWIESVLGRPVDELVKEELNEILRQQQQEDLGNVDTESKPGFSQGYGRK